MHAAQTPLMFYIVPAIMVLSIVAGIVRAVLRWSSERKRREMQERLLTERRFDSRQTVEPWQDPAAGSGPRPGSLEDSYLDAVRRTEHRP